MNTANREPLIERQGSRKRHVAYHYTSDSIWHMINAGYFGQKALVPYRGLSGSRKDPRFPDWAYDKHTFCFLDDMMPASWARNPEFPGIWNRLMRQVSHFDLVVRLLKFELEESDEAYMVDWAHMERLRPELYRMGIFAADESDKEKIWGANMEYINSRVPIADYNDDYSLPELVIRNNISLDRIVSAKVVF